MRRGQPADLVPEGCLSLLSAYEQFASRLWCGHKPVEELSDPSLYKKVHPEIAWRCRIRVAKINDLLREEFRKPFIVGLLEARVRPNGSAENFVVPNTWWRNSCFPERLFYTDVIEEASTSPWSRLNGRSPFVKCSEFETWLAEQIQPIGDPNSTASPANQELREILRGLARLGVMKSADIEARAERWGLPPIAARPAPDQHDPMKRSHWTLCMAASWIAWRTLDDVRLSTNEYRSEYLEWADDRECFAPCDGQGLQEAISVTGEVPKPLGPTSLSWLRSYEGLGMKDRESPLVMSIKSTREELWQQLGDGVLTATALDASDRVVTIPAHEWSRLELAESLEAEDKLVFEHWKIKTVYTNVRLPRSAVMELWQAPVSSNSGPVQTRRDIVELVDGAEESPVAAREQKVGRKANAVRRALISLYPHGRPDDLSDKQALANVNDWLHENGNCQVSITTLRRVIHSM